MKPIEVQKYVYQTIAIVVLALVLVQTSFAGTHFSESSKILYRNVVDSPAELLNKDYVKQQIDYPRAAFLAGFEGKLIAKVYVNENGKVDEVEFVKSIGAAFEKSVRNVILESKYNPAVYKGEPVKSVSYVTFKFELK